MGPPCVVPVELRLISRITQIYFPDGVSAVDVLPRFATKGVVVAGGLHASIKGSIYYFIKGHGTDHYWQTNISALGWCFALLNFNVAHKCTRHMGVTAVEPQRGDIDKVIDTLKEAIAEAKASKKV